MSISISISNVQAPEKSKILFDPATTALIASVFISSEVGMILFIIAEALPYGMFRFGAMGLAGLATLYFFIKFTIKVYKAEVALTTGEAQNSED